jgi:hypothetical protein
MASERLPRVVRRRINLRSLLAPFVVFAASVMTLAAAPRAAEAVADLCPNCGIIAAPVYVNVYWDTSPAQWTYDIMPGQPGTDGSSLQDTISAIDALTNASIHSGYFSGITQYGVGNVSVLPSIVVGSCGGVPKTVDDAIDQLNNFGTCVANTFPNLNNGSTVLNVILPPEVVQKTAQSDYCHKYAGEHDKFGSPVEITLNPSTSGCNSGIAALFHTMSHEMVEAATDSVPKSPTGWKNFADGEIGDLCNGWVSFLYGTVATYYNNGGATCTSGFAQIAPKYASGTICGSGKYMIVTLTGQFGPKPWDVATDAAGGNQTLYLQGAVSGAHSWAIGKFQGISPFDQVGFASIQWSGSGVAGAEPANSDTITIGGFDSGYGSAIPGPGNNISVVAPGDALSYTIWSPVSGQSVTTDKLGVPFPNAITVAASAVTSSGLSAWPGSTASTPTQPAPWLFLNDSATITGSVSQQTPSGATCPSEGSNIALSSNDHGGADITPASTYSSSDGSFTATYKPNGNAGTITITATASGTSGTSITGTGTIQVHPEIWGLSAAYGTTTGQQNVSVSEAGFPSLQQAGVRIAAGTQPTDASANGNNLALRAGTISFSTPPSPLGGDGTGPADVIANIGGVDSLPLTYTYIIPGKPVMVFYVGECEGSKTQLTVSAFNADGTLDPESIVLTAPYNAFQNGTKSSITVTAGDTVPVQGQGPFTATPPSPASATVATAPLPGFKYCRPLYYNPQGTPGLPVFGSGSTEIWTRNGFSPGGGGDYWTPPGERTKTISFTVLGSTAELDRFSARTLGLSAFRNLIRMNPNSFSAAPTGSRIVFLGPNVQVVATSLQRNEPIAQPAAISFGTGNGSGGTGYHIVHLSTPSGSGVWTEIDSTVRRGAITARIGETGIYALAHTGASTGIGNLR